MTIDIFSMIIGGILWGLLSSYIYFEIKPKIRKWKVDRECDKDDSKKQKKSEQYKDTTMGFTDTTK